MIITTPLETYLRSAAAQAAVGDRLPTVRHLMREFGLSQQAVEKTLNILKTEGVISAHVGRGTFFTGGQVMSRASSPNGDRSGRSVLFLRRSVTNQRGRFVLDDVRRRLVEAGHVTLEVAYSAPDHARRVLQGLPKFDGCILQNSFDTMPVDMMAAIRKKTDTIVVDGAWLVGTDIDAVGFEWGQSVEAAALRLLSAGCDKICLLMMSSFTLANEMGLHRWRFLRSTHPERNKFLPEIQVPTLPTLQYEEAVVAEIEKIRGAAGTLGVIVWGVEEGKGFRERLHDAGMSVPDDISVVLLGRTDIQSETSGFFHMIGYNAAEQSAAVYERLTMRWQQPRNPYELKFVSMVERLGGSLRLSKVS